MWYIKSECETGDYVTPDGTRVAVIVGGAPCPTTGWTWFDTFKECIEAWGITYAPLPEPEPQPESEN